VTPLDALATTEPDPPETRSNLASWYTPGFSDSLGDRLLMFDNTTSTPLELLRFKPEFADAPGFETALRQRVAALSGFDHASFATARAVRRLDTSEGLALVSDHTSGRRLSDVLHLARGPALATKLVLRLAPALAALADAGSGFAHGSLTADRIIVTPGGGLVIVEHVIGSALETLRLPPHRLRSEFGLTVTEPLGAARLDSSSDVVQLGLIALSLLLGRKLAPAQDQGTLARLVHELASSGVAVPRHLQVWLERALRLDGPTFESARDAASALDGWACQDAFLPEHPRHAANDQDFDELDREDAPASPLPAPPPRPLTVVPSPFARLYSVPSADSVESVKPAPSLSMRRARWIIGTLAFFALAQGMLVTGMWLGRGQTPVVTITVPEPRAAVPPLPVPAETLSAPPPAELPAPPEPAHATVPQDAKPARPAPALVDGPTGTLSMTAQPWANVWIDGEPLGRTPVARFAAAAGAHDILWRHPELGERRQRIDITAETVLTLNMNLREEN